MLEKVGLGMTQAVSPTLLDGASIEIIEDVIARQMLVSLKAYVFGEPEQTFSASESFAYPATWVQHLKQRHAPFWLLCRWPVRERRRTLSAVVDLRAVYPDLHVAKDLGRVQVLSRTTWQSDDGPA